MSLVCVYVVYVLRLIPSVGRDGQIEIDVSRPASRLSRHSSVLRRRTLRSNKGVSQDVSTGSGRVSKLCIRDGTALGQLNPHGGQLNTRTVGVDLRDGSLAR